MKTSHIVATNNYFLKIYVFTKCQKIATITSIIFNMVSYECSTNYVTVWRQPVDAGTTQPPPPGPPHTHTPA